MRTVMKGHYYRFHRSHPGNELGEEIPMASAMVAVRGGRDVYTLNRSDAWSLARSVFPGEPEECSDGNPNHFLHYHPGGIHPGYDGSKPKSWERAKTGFGHIFFNLRGEQ